MENYFSEILTSDNYPIHIINIYDKNDFEQVNALQVLIKKAIKNQSDFRQKNYFLSIDSLSTDETTFNKELFSNTQIIFIYLSNHLLNQNLHFNQLMHQYIEDDASKNIVWIPLLLDDCWWEETIFAKKSITPLIKMALFDEERLIPELKLKIIHNIEQQIRMIRNKTEEKINLLNKYYTEASNKFKNRHQDKDALRIAIDYYKKAEELCPFYLPELSSKISNQLSICIRELNFKRLATEAKVAYDEGNFESAVLLCEDALDLRSDAEIEKLYKEVKNILHRNQLEVRIQPFHERLEKADQYLVEMEWENALEQYRAALDIFDEDFELPRKKIETKIRIALNEIRYQELKEVQEKLLKEQNYDGLITEISKALKEMYYNEFYNINLYKDRIESLKRAKAYYDKKSKAWGYIDSVTNQVIINPRYTAAHDFSENLACVKKWDKWGYIDIEENIIIPFVFDFAEPFKNSKAKVHKSRMVYVIDKSGEKSNW